MYEQERLSLRLIQGQLDGVDIEQLSDIELMELARFIDCQMNGYCQQLVFMANDIINNNFNDVISLN